MTFEAVEDLVRRRWFSNRKRGNTSRSKPAIAASEAGRRRDKGTRQGTDKWHHYERTGACFLMIEDEKPDDREQPHAQQP
jgi:hypothetical protein